jgi:hypothetical protein
MDRRYQPNNDTTMDITGNFINQANTIFYVSQPEISCFGPSTTFLIMIMRSPLILGFNLPVVYAWTKKLLLEMEEGWGGRWDAGMGQERKLWCW